MPIKPKRPCFSLEKLNIHPVFSSEALFDGSVTVRSQNDARAKLTVQLRNRQMQGLAFDNEEAEFWDKKEADGEYYFHRIFLQGQFADILSLRPAELFTITIKGHDYRVKPLFRLTRSTHNANPHVCPIPIIRASYSTVNKTRSDLGNLNSICYARCVEVMLAIYSSRALVIKSEMTMYGVVLMPFMQDAAVLQLRVDSSLIKHIENRGYAVDDLPERVCKIHRPSGYSGEARFANKSYRHAFIKLMGQLFGIAYDESRDNCPEPSG